MLHQDSKCDAGLHVSRDLSEVACVASHREEHCMRHFLSLIDAGVLADPCEQDGFSEHGSDRTCFSETCDGDLKSYEAHDGGEAQLSDGRT